MYVFRTLSEVHEIIEKWMIEYNEERPHETLGDLTPSEFLAAQSIPAASKMLWH